MSAPILTRLTPPDDEPVSLGDAKLQLRVGHDADDTAIAAMISAARLMGEEWTRRSFCLQDWRLEIETSDGDVRLPMGPVQGINAVSLVDENGSLKDISETAYYQRGDALVWRSLPAGNRLMIDYTAGAFAADEVPATIRQAILAQLVWLYDRRGEAAWSPQALALLSSHREVRL